MSNLIYRLSLVNSNQYDYYSHKNIIFFMILILYASIYNYNTNSRNKKVDIVRQSKNITITYQLLILK